MKLNPEARREHEKHEGTMLSYQAFENRPAQGRDCQIRQQQKAFRLRRSGGWLLLLVLWFADLPAISSISKLTAQELRGNSSNVTPVSGALADDALAKASGFREERSSPEVALRYEWLQYNRQIAEAQHAWEAGDAADAWRHLNSCRFDFRGWEHNYLFTLFTKNQRVLKTQGPVTSLAFSPDGRQIVSAYAWVVRTWDSASGRELLTFKPQMEATSEISSSTVGCLVSDVSNTVQVASGGREFPGGLVDGTTV